jgi:3-hydroxy acid dehydrogenase / malonic semialdehyde reductase
MLKTVLITGASAGIGEATAELFAENQWNLILMARRKDRLEEMKEYLSGKYGVQVHVLVADIQNPSEVENAIDSLPESFSHIDVLVNNAGLAIGRDKAHETAKYAIDAMIDTNIKGVLHLLNAVVPIMEKQNSGTIINLSSIAGHEAYPGGAVYCATKYAVDAITKSLRMDLMATPIRVGAVSPGLVDTEFSLVRFEGDEALAKSVYVGYDPLLAKDIAEAIYFSATRPAHVQIADIIILPTAQASATMVYKK